MIQLRQYQYDAVMAGVDHNLLNNFDCGLGKTVTAIETARAVTAMLKPHIPGGVLVICPKRLRLQWMYMIQEQDPDVPVVIAPGGMPFDANKIDGWLITHFEAAVADIGFLKRRTWPVMIIDEAHHIKTRSAKRTTELKQIRAYRKIALTATPFDKSPAELWSIYHWLYPEKYTSYWKFVAEYCTVEEIDPWVTKSRGIPPGVVKIVGARNEEQLARETHAFHIRITKEQAAPELPPLTETWVPVEMTEPQKELYDKIRNAKDIVVDDMVIPNVLAKLTKLQRITSDPSGYGVYGPGKFEWLREFLDDNPNEVVVIFTRFRDTAFHLAEIYECGCIVGGVLDAPKGFLRKEDRIVVGTIDAMGEGIDILKRASTAIFIDQEWSTTKMTQAKSRIHRLGVDSPKQAIYLYCPLSVDQLIRDSLAFKWGTQELVYHALEDVQSYLGEIQ